jgi:hypothetical protein
MIFRAGEKLFAVMFFFCSQELPAIFCQQCPVCFLRGGQGLAAGTVFLYHKRSLNKKIKAAVQPVIFPCASRESICRAG